MKRALTALALCLALSGCTASSAAKGKMDEQGRMIIEPALPLDNSDQVQLCLSEGLIIGSLNGNMVFIQVSRS